KSQSNRKAKSPRRKKAQQTAHNRAEKKRFPGSSKTAARKTANGMGPDSWVSTGIAQQGVPTSRCFCETWVDREMWPVSHSQFKHGRLNLGGTRLQPCRQKSHKYSAL